MKKKNKDKRNMHLNIQGENQSGSEAEKLAIIIAGMLEQVPNVDRSETSPHPNAIQFSLAANQGILLVDVHKSIAAVAIEHMLDILNIESKEDKMEDFRQCRIAVLRF